MSNRVTLSLQHCPHLPYGHTYSVLCKGPGADIGSQTHKALTSQPAWHSHVLFIPLPQSHSLQKQPATNSHQAHTHLLLTVQYLSRSWSQQPRHHVRRPRGRKRHADEKGPQPTQCRPDPNQDLAGPGRLWSCDSRPWLRCPRRDGRGGRWAHRAVDSQEKQTDWQMDGKETIQVNSDDRTDGGKNGNGFRDKLSHRPDSWIEKIIDRLTDR